MICPTCGNTIDDGAATCPRCGSSTSGRPAGAPASDPEPESEPATQAVPAPAPRPAEAPEGPAPATDAPTSPATGVPQIPYGTGGDQGHMVRVIVCVAVALLVLLVASCTVTSALEGGGTQAPATSGEPASPDPDDDAPEATDDDHDAAPQDEGLATAAPQDDAGDDHASATPDDAAPQGEGGPGTTPTIYPEDPAERAGTDQVVGTYYGFRCFNHGEFNETILGVCITVRPDGTAGYKEERFEYGARPAPWSFDETREQPLVWGLEGDVLVLSNPRGEWMPLDNMNSYAVVRASGDRVSLLSRDRNWPRVTFYNDFDTARDKAHAK